MKKYKIGQKVWYQDGITIPSGYYTIDSEEQIDYGYDSDDEYYYFKELQNPDKSRLGRFRAWKVRIIPLDELLVCQECGNTNISIKHWIDPNTNIIGDTCSDGEKEDNWCDDCQKHINIITKEEYDKL